MDAVGDTVACIQIGEDIGTTEAVDGLFWIADHYEAGVLIVIRNTIDTIKNLILYLVSILKLIYQTGWELLPNLTC